LTIPLFNIITDAADHPSPTTYFGTVLSTISSATVYAISCLLALPGVTVCAPNSPLIVTQGPSTYAREDQGSGFAMQCAITLSAPAKLRRKAIDADYESPAKRQVAPLAEGANPTTSTASAATSLTAIPLPGISVAPYTTPHANNAVCIETIPLVVGTRTNTAVVQETYVATQILWDELIVVDGVTGNSEEDPGDPGFGGGNPFASGASSSNNVNGGGFGSQATSTGAARGGGTGKFFPPTQSDIESQN
jgi:hypothetical protein